MSIAGATATPGRYPDPVQPLQWLNRGHGVNFGASEQRLVPDGAPVARQGVRFLVSGGFVAVVYVLSTSLLANVVELRFGVALAIGYGVAIAAHFTLQRVFVWTHDAGFALDVRGQLARYLPVAAVQYGLTAVSTSTMPKLVGVATEIVYLVTAVLLSIATFLVFRSSIFHQGQPDRRRPRTT